MQAAVDVAVNAAICLFRRCLSVRELRSCKEPTLSIFVVLSSKSFGIVQVARANSMHNSKASPAIAEQAVQKNLQTFKETKILNFFLLPAELGSVHSPTGAETLSADFVPLPG